MDNKFITRGISKKTNEFVFGYPYKDSKNWHLMAFIDPLEKQRATIRTLEYVLKEGLVEITQEPDSWTGLYDKNENLIYERDIIKDTRENRIFIVLWDNGCLGFTFKLKNKDSFIRFEYTTPLDIIRDNTMEVLGNTHFNPELLENK